MVRRNPRDLIFDPHWMLRKMRIEHKNGGFCTLGEAGVTPIQDDLISTLSTGRHTLVLKSRQMHVTTITVLYMMFRLLTAGGSYRAGSTTHEGGAVGRISKMFKVARDGLPLGLRPALSMDNMKSFEIARNQAAWFGMMAGGRGEGRSWTYQFMHATEMGFWPKGSSARSGTAVDEDVWSSIQAAMHEESQKVIESTANGPGGVFHRMVQLAQTSPEWEFRFYPWFDQAAYAKRLPEGWKPRSDEQELAALYDLSLEQLCWRRSKMEDEGYSLERFKREYPSNPAEPFMVSGGMWFDVDALNMRLALVIQEAPHRTQQKPGLHIVHDYEPGRRYGIGLDPSGGTGNDEAALSVVRDDGEQVAWFASRDIKPRRLAEIAAKVQARYGGALINVERNNKYGRATLDRLQQLGAKLWVGSKGQTWHTDERTKNMLLDYAAAVIDGNMVRLNDPLLIQQLLQIREQDDGKIEANPGYNDDRAMALFLALWCTRRIFSKTSKKSLRREVTERAKARLRRKDDVWKPRK